MKKINKFLTSIKDKECVVGVIGLGYVGLPLALEFCKKSFRVIGFDLDTEKIKSIEAGQTYIKHIPADGIDVAVKAGFLSATTDFSRIADTDAVLICVPTPLTKHREPDLSYIESTAKAISPYLHSDHLIVLESTTYPGTTEEVMAKLLEDGSGMKAGEDFWVAFSPEREDPTNPAYSTSNIPKVVGGINKDSSIAACALYDQVIIKTVPVSSCAAAEATKLLENIFRCVNIALMNELKVIFFEMGIDVWEVIKAAKTKPFGYMPFYPGPGLGGHCIPIDPFYLTWKAKEFGLTTRFIELAGEINTSMPNYVVTQTMEALNEQSKSLKGSKVLIVGLAYKGNVDDMRESPSLVLINMFEEKGAEVAYYDPYIPEIPPVREHAHLTGRKSITLEEAGNYDVAVISTQHLSVDHTIFADKCKLVIDTRNALGTGYPNVHQA